MVAYSQDGTVGASGVLNSPASQSLPWWLSISVVLGAVLMAAGALIAVIRPAMLVSAGAEINESARVYAGYLFSRNLSLALMLLIILGTRARGALSTLMVLTAFIQLLDAGVDCVEGRWPLVPGVLVFAIVYFVGAARLSGRAFWRIAAWRDPVGRF